MFPALLVGLEPLDSEPPMEFSKLRTTGCGSGTEYGTLKDFEENNISQESIDRGKRVYKKLLEHQKSMETKGTDDKWESEEGNKDSTLKNGYHFEINDNHDQELNELYKTLDGLEKNDKVSNENKIIIQEYLRILIKDKLDEKNK